MVLKFLELENLNTASSISWINPPKLIFEIMVPESKNMRHVPEMIAILLLLIARKFLDTKL